VWLLVDHRLRAPEVAMNLWKATVAFALFSVARWEMKQPCHSSQTVVEVGRHASNQLPLESAWAERGRGVVVVVVVVVMGTANLA